MAIRFRPLGAAREIIEGAGLQVSWAYDDLVFIDGNPFILRFNDEIVSQMFLHFNTDCEPAAKKEIEANMVRQGLMQSYNILIAEDYCMKEKAENEELEIEFLK